jgi:hypothetical protein
MKDLLANGGKRSAWLAHVESGRQLEAAYEIPLQSHATMEPMNRIFKRRETGRCQLVGSIRSPMLGAVTAWLSLTSGETLLLNASMSCAGGHESKVARAAFCLHYPSPYAALQGRAKAASLEVELYTLDCGRIDIPDMDPFADDGS